MQGIQDFRGFRESGARWGFRVSGDSVQGRNRDAGDSGARKGSPGFRGFRGGEVIQERGGDSGARKGFRGEEGIPGIQGIQGR